MDGVPGHNWQEERPGHTKIPIDSSDTWIPLRRAPDAVLDNALRRVPDFGPADNVRVGGTKRTDSDIDGTRTVSCTVSVSKILVIWSCCDSKWTKISPTRIHRKNVQLRNRYGSPI